jgi:hypothetical protein
MTDSLLEVLMELRRDRPPVWDCDARLEWFEAIGQVISAMHDPARQWAAKVLIASDLATSMPGLPLALAFGVVENAVRNAAIKKCV